MWKTFISENDIYMLKVNENDDDIEVHLTNFSKHWFCKQPKQFIIQKFQESNPIVDVKIDQALLHALKLLYEIDSVQVSFKFLGSKVTLCIESNLSDLFDANFKIKFELEFFKSEDDSLTQTVTIPLVQTVIILEKQQEMMKKLLLKKDRELEEYQMEKGEISRSDLITEKFESDILVSSSNKLMVNVFNKIEAEIAKKYGGIDEKVAEIEVETWNNIKKKRKIYNKETAAKAKCTKIMYKSEKKS